MISTKATTEARAQAAALRIRLHITGRVQGIGFRPELARRARAAELGGEIRNGPAGVFLLLEGREHAIRRCLRELEAEPPAGSAIEEMRMLCESSIDPAAASDIFYIRPSHAGDGGEVDRWLDLPLDSTPCNKCRNELLDPDDPRYLHPFISCTACGPRYSILEDLPYDRARTTMGGFPLCSRCTRQYHDPTDRRFHAEPIACPDCGPKLKLIGPAAGPGDPIEVARTTLLRGGLVGVLGTSGFHLACDATNAQAVARVRALKQRPSKPLALMFADPLDLRRWARPTGAEMRLLQAPHAPVVLVRRIGDASQLPGVADENPWIGAMLPSSPVHHLLLRSLPPLVMTSLNRRGEPIACRDSELPPLFDARAGIDLALSHDRNVAHPLDDSVCRIWRGKTILLRRGRGLAPAALDIAPAGAEIVAMGAQMRSTLALCGGGRAVVSPYLGDLSYVAVAQRHDRERSALEKLLRVRPRAVACDMHPDYESTRMARGLGIDLLPPVQHHHAHMAAVHGEHRLDPREAVTALVLDGTGFGTDGTVWGGEVLVGNRLSFHRAAHLAPLPLPGGDAAVRDPRRLAVALLARDGATLEDTAWLPLFESIDPGVARAWATMAGKPRLAPTASSAGRLLDGISALLGVQRAPISYDAEAACRLEAIAAGSDANDQASALPNRGDTTVAPPASTPRPPNDQHPRRDPEVLPTTPIVHRAITALRSATPIPCIAAQVHEDLAGLFASAAIEIASRGGPTKVVLAGGCYVNTQLLEHTARPLEEAGLDILVPELLPPGDESIAYGQLCVARARAGGS